MKWVKANIIPAFGSHVCKVRINEVQSTMDVAYMGRWILPEGEVLEYLDESPSPDPDILVRALEEIHKKSSSERQRRFIETALNNYKNK